MSDIFDKIHDELASHDVVLYMKGNAKFPMCGYSSAVIQILKALEVNFKDVDVLQDADLREGIKSFTNWPTLPQLYVKGEFVGGCDIVREMHQLGELKDLFVSKGISFSAAA